ncbi:desmosome associated protein-like protein pinnin isoform X1 [Rhipicephalus microplus]|uniref:desmosome associated protein-like protein pinnin isoform X1 n=1 Tax=Rhipicephalus microplus TaxID=6941 RepID=UPI003F6D2866
MAASGVFSLLKAEFEAAQKSLKDVDETIKKLTGRNPEEFRNQARRQAGPAQKAATEQGGRERFTKKPAIATAGPPAKRRNLGGPPLRTPIEAPAEDSGDEEELPRKGGVQSSVVAAPAKDSLRTRREVSALQKGDRKCMERNRRMFGMMLGTLQKFQSEETKRKDQVQSQKRAEIEQKLEQAAEREKAELRKERQDLFLARRQKQQGIRRLELKMEVARLHEEAEARQRLLLNFIHTRTKPHIMFKPARHTPETEKRLKESQKRILAIIESRRAKVKEELDAIDELYHRDNINAHAGEEEEEEIYPDKENRGPSKDQSVEDEEQAAVNSGAEPSTDADRQGRVEAKSEPRGNGEVAEGTATTKATDGDVEEPMDTAEPAEAAKGQSAAGDRSKLEAAKETTANRESAEGSTEPTENEPTTKAADTSEESAKAEEEPLKEEAPVAPAEVPSINALGDEKFEPIYDE